MQRNVLSMRLNSTVTIAHMGEPRLEWAAFHSIEIKWGVTCRELMLVVLWSISFSMQQLVHKLLLSQIIISFLMKRLVQENFLGNTETRRSTFLLSFHNKYVNNLNSLLVSHPRNVKNHDLLMAYGGRLFYLSTTLQIIQNFGMPNSKSIRYSLQMQLSYKMPADRQIEQSITYKIG